MDTIQEELHGYVHDCQILKREFEQAITHHRLTADGRFRIRLAVDFSEVFAFALPGKSSSELHLFDVNGGSNRDDFQRIVLSRLFTRRTSDQLILLRPYAQELHSFLYRLALREFHTEVEQSFAALREIAELEQNTEYQRLVKLAFEKSDPSAVLSENDRTTISTFLEKNAPNVLLLIGSNERSPLALIGDLMDRNIFRDLEAEIDVLGEDNAIFDRWNLNLVKQRRDERPMASTLDAMAVALLARANRELASRRERMILITRSRSMHDLFESEVQQGYWREFGDYLLLHPRALGILYTVQSHFGEEAIAYLLNALKPINDFLNSTGSLESREPLDSENHRQLTDLQGRIYRDWKAIEALAASLLEVAESSKTDNNRPNAPGPETLISLVRNKPELRERIKTRFGQLGETLERRHCGLVLYIQEPIEIRDTFKAEEFEVKLVLACNSPAMPYSLQLFSSLATGVRQVFEKSKADGWRKILELFGKDLDKDTDVESDYERFLLVSFVLGAFNRWDWAESYCLRALQVAGDRQDLFLHEGYFLLGVCLRKHNPTLERLLRSLSCSERALKIKRKRRNDMNYKDPRYLKEMATQIFSLNVDHRNKLPPGVPDGKQGLELLREAEPYCGSDWQLLVQILNNRLFYYLATEVLEDRNMLENMVRDLLTLQKQFVPNEDEWPPEIHDTVAWAEWLLNRDNPTLETSGIVRRLRLAYASRFASKGVKDRINEHLQIVRNHPHRSQY